jgi:hypothetical protein
MPRYMLTLKGTILTELALEPRYLNFRQLHVDGVVTQAVTLRSRRPDVRITAARSDNTSFRADIDADGRGLSVVSVPPLTPGFQHAAVRVETDHPEGLTTTLQVAAAVVGDITVIPRDVLLRRGQMGPQRRAVLLRPTGPHPLRVSKVDVPLPGVTVTTNTLQDGSFSVVMEGIRTAADLDGKQITITTGVASTPRVVVPVRVLP